DDIETAQFIATEFIEGQTLRARMKVAPVKPLEAIDVSIQVASALDAAHCVGIVHRDIKPENIMLRRDGIVKVLDFGIAKLTSPQTGPLTDGDAPTLALVNTQAGMVLGTAQYMSPEQARGLDVDPRTDIWSLGCVLYEMVAGRQPFLGLTILDVLSGVLDREPDPLADHMPDGPREFERIVCRALRKDREQRYQTVKDLLIDLKDLSNDLELQSRRVSSQVTVGTRQDFRESASLSFPERSIAVLYFENM